MITDKVLVAEEPEVDKINCAIDTVNWLAA